MRRGMAYKSKWLDANIDDLVCFSPVLNKFAHRGLICRSMMYKSKRVCFPIPANGKHVTSH